MSKLNVIPREITSSQKKNTDVAETFNIISTAFGDLSMSPYRRISIFPGRFDRKLIKFVILLIFYIVLVELLSF
jgi:hypothetical protein